MDEQNAFFSMMLHRFFEKFDHVTYHKVPICKYAYYQFISFLVSRWSLDWAKQNLPYWQDEINRLNRSRIYDWADEPYPYDPHPGGIVLMRGGFGDLALQYMAADHFFLLSPNQAEVDLIKLNRPDLTAHSIEQYYRENPTAVKTLIGQIIPVIQDQKDDPILGSPDLQRWFLSKTAEFVRILDAAQSLFEKMEVGAVLTISSIYWMDSALNLIARANRIPSFTLQHGLILDRDLVAHIPLLATKKLVWGRASSEWYQRHGYPESRVCTIGSPRFDMIFNQKWRDKKELCQLAGIDPAQKIIVYATRPTGFMENIPALVINGLKTIPDLFLLILLHPGEASSVAEYRQLAADYPHCKVVQFGHISLYDALSGADLFITYDSTAALEAMLFKLPVITVEPSSACFSYGNLGASIRVTDSTELNQVVRKLLVDETFRTHAVACYQDFLSAYCIPDGSASQRLFATMEQLRQTGGIA